MRIIFLDIDGVMNHQLWFESILGKPEFKREKKNDYRRYFSTFAVKLLNNLTDETGAKIVVSSSWRNGRTVAQLRKMFRDNGITGKVIDKTPYLSYEGYSSSVPRGCEIHAWLEINKKKFGDSVKYVIFDDDSDMLWWQRNNFLLVDTYCGLTPNLIYKAKNILTK